MAIAIPKNITNIKGSLGMPCIICGESVELTPNEVMSLEYGSHIRSKVCDKCKTAVLCIREQME